MPTVVRQPDATLSAETDEEDALWHLAAKGAYAVAAGAADAVPRGDYVVRSERPDGPAVPPVVSAAAFLRARCRGWIAADTDGGRYHLSAAGLKAVREARSRGARRAPGRRPDPAGRPVAGSAGGAPRAAQERPLAWLRRRKDKEGQPLVTEPQFAAGERLAADYWRAHLMPRVTADWSGRANEGRTRRAAPGVGVEIGDNVMAARQRIDRALAAVGPELSGILVAVCCHEEGLEAAERTQGWPPRSGKVVLQLALTSLARHYGLIAPRPTQAAHRLRHWASDDYRPDLGAWR
ncbi:MAG: DUF6456 domain-containing protein [Hyphomicrobiaceae bacterium]